MKNDFSHIFLLYQGKEPDMARINRQNRRTERDSRLERISRMEDRYNEVMRKLAALEEAVADYGHLQREIEVLEEYMSSGLWQKDYEADEAGEIPAVSCPRTAYTTCWRMPAGLSARPGRSGEEDKL